MQILGQILPQTIRPVLVGWREERNKVKVKCLTSRFLRIESDGEGIIAVRGKNTGFKSGFKLCIVVDAEVAVEFHIGFCPNIICKV